MPDVTFGRLPDIALREAWSHEALSFTPWLASNIEHIAEAIGISLELTGTEVSVGSFSADILARNPEDGSLVLIENQLEATDHTHLGQILTYLAGLDARTVVWIAPRFREPHLSAIRWLNQHTAGGFSFFALSLRLFRIGDSPYAPVFEVVEKPSSWERSLSEARREASGELSTLGQQRLAYWTLFAERQPVMLQAAPATSSVSFAVPKAPDLKIVAWIGQAEGGIFVRGQTPLSVNEVRNRLAPDASALETALGAPFLGRTALLPKSTKGGLASPESWPGTIDWQAAQVSAYIEALSGTGSTM